MIEEEQLLTLLIELKEDVAAMRADIKEIAIIKKDVENIKGRMNVAQGMAIVVGALFSIAIAYVSKLFKP